MVSAGSFGFARLGETDKRNIALGDGRLFRGDQGQGRSQVLLMVEADTRDPAGRRTVNDVGCIEAPAEPNFEDSRVRRLAGKSRDRSGGRNFEETRLDVGARADHLAQQGFKPPVFDQLAANTDAFVETHKVGTGERVNLEASGLHPGAKEGDSRALAVGASNMKDRRHAILRPVEAIE